jgi:hypothetical protein
MMPRISTLSFFVLAACTAGSAWVVAAPDADGIAFFEKQVRPLLAERCYECHSVSKKIKGGLALDTREATLKGGDSGPALVAGDLEKSKIIEAIRYQNHDLQMPPKGQLSTSEVKVFEDWIKRGAPDPRTGEAVAVAAGPRVINIEEGRKFWSFKPVARVSLPRVEHPSAPIKTPIDLFIQAKLREKGLTSAPPADKLTLLRRATFDMTGLPPTPQEVEAFIKDDSPAAFDRVIERLLASPQYGVRWGRHWLDVARYADSNGMDENVAFGNAWRYRDYVVRAFNNDKPFDQFLIEQVAGDLLPHSEEAVTATGFLSLGARVAAEPDLRKLEMDIIDEQLDTLGKAFLGMTFGCARCHDHKFDPIRQDDYYAMAAIFRSTKSIADDKMGAIKFCYERSIATPEQIEAKKKYDAVVKKKQSELTAYITKTKGVLKDELHHHAADYLAAAATLHPDPMFSEVQKVAGAQHLRPRYLLTCRQYLERHPDHPFFAAWREAARNNDAAAVQQHYAPLFTEALSAKKGEAYDALADVAGFLAIPERNEDAFDGEMFSKFESMQNEFMAVEDKTPDPPAIMSVTDSANIAQTLPIHLRGSYLTLGKPVERGFPEVMRTSFVQPILPVKQSGRLELARWMASSEHPLTARVIVNRVWRWHFGQGIVNSTDNFGVLGNRPSHPELLDWLARTFIEDGWSIKDLHRMIMKSSVYQQSSKIPDVAFRISEMKAPKTTETVVVNQQGTFKEETPNSRSERLNPKLSDPRLVDPENQLLWRFNIQRLEAEEIRDAMLFASGWLNMQIGGKTVPLRDREFVFNHTSKDHTTYETPRRALYLPIIRNNIYNMLEQFDYPDPTMPTGSRNSTVIAPQALIMMNSPVVMECGTKLAAQLTAISDESERVNQACLLLYGRPAAEKEKGRVLSLVNSFAQSEKPERAWALAFQTLIAANEFMYLR